MIYFLLIACFTDIFAFVTGKLIGRKKLAKEISPNKTVEGFIGGTIMGTFIGMVYYLTVVSNQIPFTQILIITITLSIMGQIGDLIFSQIKRYYHQKDFSNLVPGHGGILDLFDSLIFVIITSILFISIFKE